MCYGKQDEKGENSKAAKKERKNQGDNFFFSFLKRRKEKKTEKGASSIPHMPTKSVISELPEGIFLLKNLLL